jgi:hypothetical protein
MTMAAFSSMKAWVLAPKSVKSKNHATHLGLQYLGWKTTPKTYSIAARAHGVSVWMGIAESHLQRTGLKGLGRCPRT